VDHNINLLEKTNCTGCGLCYNACPFNAISMLEDSEGFLSPFVDKNMCTNCGICANMCPQLSNKSVFYKTRECLAFVGDDAIRKISSSGGVFGTLANWLIKQGGTVYGATFNTNFDGVFHVGVSSESSLKPLLKSKYVQSDLGEVFKEIKTKLLSSEKNILFVGCPCQVDALKIFLAKDYDNLFTIDLFCHGAVSPLAYRKFLEVFFGDVDSPIIDVDFRNKEYGWGHNLKVTASDGTSRIMPYDGDYFNAFLWGYSQRNCCFNCKYAKSDRVGDISIGDFWGINEVLPEMNDRKGTSQILINTMKGEKLLKILKNCPGKIKNCDYEIAKKIAEKTNWAIVKPSIKPFNRDSFFYRLNKGDTFTQAFDYANTGLFDVGIFGWWFEDSWTNYGSTLTYYALMEYVSSLGLSVCMITSPFHNKNNASEFVKKHGYIMTETYDFKFFYHHNKKIKTFLLGSDQLWFYHCYNRWGYSLFFDFVAKEKKKIAYSTSFGHSNPMIPKEEIPKLKPLLNRFDAISVREFDGVKTLSELFDIPAVQTLDPVFLCDLKNWDEIAKCAKNTPQNDFLFSYMLDPDKRKVSALKHVSKKLKLDLISITDKQYQKKEKEEILKGCGVLRNSTIEDLIFYIKNAKFIITDSFHGTCFALIFRKPFIAIVNNKRGTSRFDTISQLFGIEDRLVNSAEEILTNVKLLTRPDYYKISPRIETAIMKSKAWLNNELLKNKL